MKKIVDSSLKQIIFLKLGGSVITDKEQAYTVKRDVIKDLAKQIKRAIVKLRDTHLIVGNGAGSFAHYPAQLYKMNEGIKKEEQKIGFCLVADAAEKLNRIVVEEFLTAGIRAFSIHPSSIFITRGGRIIRAFSEPIKKLLDLAIMPVLYGDIVSDAKDGCHILSTERILSFFAILFKKKGWQRVRMIHSGVTRGVLDERGRVISRITRESFGRLASVFTNTKGYDVTGGMLHKVKEALSLVQEGIESLIINGVGEKDLLYRALCGETVVGTRITA